VAGDWRRMNKLCGSVVESSRLEVGWACRTQGEYEKCIRNFSVKT
jgi:hypothetical protein